MRWMGTRIDWQVFEWVKGFISSLADWLLTDWLIDWYILPLTESNINMQSLNFVKKKFDCMNEWMTNFIHGWMDVKTGEELSHNYDDM